MPERVLPAHDQASVDGGSGSSQLDFIYKAAERFGMPTILLLMVLFWIRTDFLKPLLDAHYEFLAQIRQSSQRHTEKLDDLIDLLKRQNALIQGRLEFVNPKSVSMPDTQPSG